MVVYLGLYQTMDDEHDSCNEFSRLIVLLKYPCRDKHAKLWNLVLAFALLDRTHRAFKSPIPWKDIIDRTCILNHICASNLSFVRGEKNFQIGKNMIFVKRMAKGVWYTSNYDAIGLDGRVTPRGLHMTYCLVNEQFSCFESRVVCMSWNWFLLTRKV